MVVPELDTGGGQRFTEQDLPADLVEPAGWFPIDRAGGNHYAGQVLAHATPSTVCSLTAAEPADAQCWSVTWGVDFRPDYIGKNMAGHRLPRQGIYQSEAGRQSTCCYTLTKEHTPRRVRVWSRCSEMWPADSM